MIKQPTVKAKSVKRTTKTDSAAPVDVKKEPAAAPVDVKKEPAAAPVDVKKEPAAAPVDVKKEPAAAPVDVKKEPKVAKTIPKNDNIATKNTSNVQAELSAANEKIAILENRLNTFIAVVYREMNNDLERGPKILSKKMAQAGLLT